VAGQPVCRRHGRGRQAGPAPLWAGGRSPADPALAQHWHRRRRYVALGEVSALLAFATVSVVLVSYYHLDPVAAVLIAMAQGMVGFALLLDGAAWLFRKRLGLPGPAAGETGNG
jgi:hypothetical protein